MVVAIANQKGGVGKTTIATNFACLSVAEGKKTVLIDSDSQASSMAFRSIRSDVLPQFSAFSILTDTIHKDIKKLDCENVFIDAGGRDSKVFRSALLAADKVLIPVTPSQYDIWSSEETFKIISEIKLMKEDLITLVCLNQVIGSTKIAAEVSVVMNEMIEKYKLFLCPTWLFSRVAYKESVSDGMAVTEVTKSDNKYHKAAEEMTKLYREVMYDEY
jgi:chromosome partitioning protein